MWRLLHIVYVMKWLVYYTKQEVLITVSSVASDFCLSGAELCGVVAHLLQSLVWCSFGAAFQLSTFIKGVYINFVFYTVYTPISSNCTTAIAFCPVLCKFPSFHLGSSGPSGHGFKGPSGVCCVVWHRDVSSRSF